MIYRYCMAMKRWPGSGNPTGYRVSVATRTRFALNRRRIIQLVTFDNNSLCLVTLVMQFLIANNRPRSQPFCSDQQLAVSVSRHSYALVCVRTRSLKFLVLKPAKRWAQFRATGNNNRPPNRCRPSTITNTTTAIKTSWSTPPR